MENKITKSFIEKRLRAKAKSTAVKDLDNLKKIMFNNPIGKELKTSSDVNYKVADNLVSHFASNGIKKIMLQLEEEYYEELSDELLDNLNGYNDFLNDK